MKKLISIMLTISFIVFSFSVTMLAVSAAPIIWDGKRTASFAKGDGTEESPYQISNAKEFAFFAYNYDNGVIIDEMTQENYSTKHYVLTNDIYLNDISNYDKWEYGKTVPKNVWENPTGLGGYQFNGVLDGQGHSIIGAYQVRSGKGGGLFYSVGPNAVIKNLQFTHYLIYAESYAGGFIGTICAPSENQEGNGAKLINCKFSGRMEGIGSNIIGGVVGYNEGTIENCVFSGSVNSVGINVGGIAGITSNGGVISNCINYASVKSTKSAVGGISGNVGNLNLKGTISNCYNAGNVSGDGSIGGIVGTVGYKESAADNKIENCFSFGNVTATGSDKTAAGAAFGSCLPGGKITNCYYDNKVTYPGLASDQASQAGNVKGLKTAQMIGSNAVSAMKLSSKVWTNVNNYYPQIKALHDKGWTVIQSLDSGNASNAGANNSNRTGGNTASTSNNSNNVNNTENNSNTSTTDSGVITSDSVQSGEDVISENNDNSVVSEENGVTSGNDKADGNAQESGMPTGLLIAIIILAVVLVLGIVAFVIYRFHPEWLPFLKKQ